MGAGDNVLILIVDKLGGGELYGCKYFASNVQELILPPTPPHPPTKNPTKKEKAMSLILQFLFYIGYLDDWQSLILYARICIWTRYDQFPLVIAEALVHPAR